MSINNNNTWFICYNMPQYRCITTVKRPRPTHWAPCDSTQPVMRTSVLQDTQSDRLASNQAFQSKPKRAASAGGECDTRLSVWWCAQGNSYPHCTRSILKVFFLNSESPSEIRIRSQYDYYYTNRCIVILLSCQYYTRMSETCWIF